MCLDSERVEDFNTCDSRFFVHAIKRKTEFYELENKSDKKIYNENNNFTKHSVLKLNLNYQEFMDKLEQAVNECRIVVHNPITDKSEMKFILSQDKSFKVLIGNFSESHDGRSISKYIDQSEELGNYIMKLEDFLKEFETKVYEINTEENNFSTSLTGYQHNLRNEKSLIYKPSNLFTTNKNIFIETKNLNNLNFIPQNKNPKQYTKKYKMPVKGYFNYLDKLNEKLTTTSKTFLFPSDIYTNKYPKFILENELISRYISEYILSI